MVRPRVKLAPNRLEKSARILLESLANLLKEARSPQVPISVKISAESPKGHFLEMVLFVPQEVVETPPVPTLYNAFIRPEYSNKLVSAYKGKYDLCIKIYDIIIMSHG